VPGGEIRRRVCSCFMLGYAREHTGGKTLTLPEFWTEISCRQGTEKEQRTVPELVIEPAPNRCSIPVILMFVSKFKEA